MAEIVTELKMVVIYNTTTTSATVLNAYTVGSDVSSDTRTRDGAEDNRTISAAEKQQTVEAWLAAMHVRAATHAGV